MESESKDLDRDALIEQNLPLVGYQVAELLRRVPSFVQREDLASAGSLALVQAANNYNPATGVPFHRFAIFRIRGAMLDELRAMDWATRGARSRTKQLEEMTATLTAAAGRAPTREELATALGVEVEQVEAAQVDASRRVISIDVTYSEDDTRSLEIVDEGLTPEDTLLSDERLVYLKAAVKALPQRLRYVVEQVFFEDRAISDVAVSLGVTQSRVSQLRTEALAMIRDGMEHHLESDEAGEAPHEAEAKGGAKKKVGIVEKRRQSYLQKIAANAETLREAPRGEGGGAAGGGVAGVAGRGSAAVTLPPQRGVHTAEKAAAVHEVPSRVAPHDGDTTRGKSAGASGGTTSGARTTGSAKPGAVAGKTPASGGREAGKPEAIRVTSSASSFLAGRSKGSAQARAQLRAEAEARAAEEEKRKSKDKARGRRGRKPAAKETPAEPQPKPLTTPYLGGLRFQQHRSGDK